MIFLRPWAFLLLLVLPLLHFMLKRYKNVSNPWRKYVDPVFLKYLSVGCEKSAQSVSARFLVPFIWILLTLAASGPAFNKWPAAGGAGNAAPTVLIVDLNTLNAEKQSLLQVKLYELTEKLKTNSAGLVLYDTKGYVAVPLTADKEVIKALIPSLKPNIMPDSGNKLEKGVEKAVELFQNTQSKSGRIIIISGGTPDVTGAAEILKKQPYTVGILGLDDSTPTPVLTRDGAFLRDMSGQFVLAKPDKSAWEKLGVYYATTPAGSEIDSLLKQTNPLDLNVFKKAKDISFLKPDVWQDLGVYLVWGCLLFAALLFRKGLFFLFFTGFLLMQSKESLADLWRRPDQIDYQLLKAGNALYQNGQYDEAVRRYETVKTSEALYNKANALAHLKAYKEAIDLYQQVLKQNPQHEDARFNKEYLEKQLRHSDSSNAKNQKQNQQEEQPSQNQEQQEQKQNQEQQAQKQQQEGQGQNPAEESSQMDNSQKESGTNQKQQQNEADKARQEEQSPPRNQQKPSGQSEKNDSSAGSEKPENESNGETEPAQSQAPEAGNEDLSGSADAQTAGIETEKNTSPPPDQETQQIINRLQKNPSRVLQYRLYKQFLKN